MKAFLRAVSGVLLVAMLFALTLWRNDAFPDLSGITAFLKETQSRLDVITQAGEGGWASVARPSGSEGEFPEYELSEGIPPELEALICEGMLNQSESIDVSAFHKGEDYIQQVVSQIRFTHPELFFVDKNFGIKKNPDTGVVQSLEPKYTTASKAETEGMMAEYESMLAAIVASVPEGSDFDKLLYIHDYFVREYCYDQTLTIRDAYTFFKLKTGVCQAYMLALIAVAGEVGIESVPVTSSRMNHAWNMVKLDGAWYHVDVTWDDVVSYPSYTSYEYFLQSDAGIIAIDADIINESVAVPNWHCDWSSTQKATDTRYDSAVWRNSRTPIVKGQGSYYCVVSEPDSKEDRVLGGVYTGTDPATMTRLFSVNAIWMAPEGGSYYLACYSGLAVYGDLLIYNTHNSLRAYNMATGTNTQLKLFATDLGNKAIYGLCGVSADGTVSFVAAPDERGTTYTIMTHRVV